MAWGKGPASGIEDLIKRLKQSDEKLQSLTILRFRRLNDADVEALAAALQANSILQELNCSSHSVSVEASAALGAMLQHNRGLKRISIGNSSWGDQALAALAEGLKPNTVLEVWDLEHKGLSPEAGSSIGGVLACHPALQQLLLSRNALQDAGLARLCAGPWGPLQHLELADCGLTAQGLRHLAAAVSLGQLAHLDLSHNDLKGPGAAEGLQQLVAAAGQLRCLKLRNTGVGGAGVSGLAQGLPSAPLLQHLDLCCTQLDDTGLAALAAALAGRKQQLQDVAAAAAAAAAAGAGPPRQQLLLGGNPDLTDAAISSLAAALATAGVAGQGVGNSSSATEANEQQQQQQQWWQLDLAETGAGASAIQSLSQLPGLQQLSLFGCKLGTAAAAAAAAADGTQGAPIIALQQCLAAGGFAALQGLNLSGCCLSYGQLQGLMQQLAAATSSSSSSQGFAAVALKTLEVGANPGVQQHDGFEGLVQQLREGRPGLDVHWRVADSDAPP